MIAGSSRGFLLLVLLYDEIAAFVLRLDCYFCFALIIIKRLTGLNQDLQNLQDLLSHSLAFSADIPIPQRYKCKSQNPSPQLAKTNLPSLTVVKYLYLSLL